MIPENIKNFYNSKDCLYDDFRLTKKLIFLLLISAIPIIEILLYIFKIQFFIKPISMIDLIVAIIVIIFLAVNFIVACFKNALQYHYVYYGIAYIIFSCYIFYFATRMTLFPLNIVSEILGFIFWLVLSLLCIYTIFENIKNDYYKENDEHVYWMKDKKTQWEYGLVITWYTVLNLIIFIAVVLILIILNLFSFNFSISKTAQIAVVGFAICCYLLGYMAHFSWKLLIKQYYIIKYKIKVEIEHKN